MRAWRNAIACSLALILMSFQSIPACMYWHTCPECSQRCWLQLWQIVGWANASEASLQTQQVGINGTRNLGSCACHRAGSTVSSANGKPSSDRSARIAGSITEELSSCLTSCPCCDAAHGLRGGKNAIRTRHSSRDTVRQSESQQASSQQASSTRHLAAATLTSIAFSSCEPHQRLSFPFAKSHLGRLRI